VAKATNGNDESKALATVENYMVFKMEPDELRELLRENLGSAQITALDLPSIKVPSGGATFWSVPAFKGTKPAEALEGVLIHVRKVRRFWKDAYTGGKTPPDCYSEDGEIGVGDNTQGYGRHDCDTCPMAVFGTAVDQKGNPKRGQACQDRRLIFLLTETGTLPYRIDLPPTSINAVKAYLVNLLNAGVPYTTVTTRLTLEADTGDFGAYSRVVMEPVVQLTPELVAKARAYQSDIKPSLEKARVAAEAAE
jgi:hypothetical protein